MKKIYWIIAVILFSFIILSNTSYAYTCTGTQPPLEGNWLISDKTTCSCLDPKEHIDINGDILVYRNGNFTLINCSIYLKKIDAKFVVNDTASLTVDGTDFCCVWDWQSKSSKIISDYVFILNLTGFSRNSIKDYIIARSIPYIGSDPAEKVLGGHSTNHIHSYGYESEMTFTDYSKNYIYYHGLGDFWLGERDKVTNPILTFYEAGSLSEFSVLSNATIKGELGWGRKDDCGILQPIWSWASEAYVTRNFPILVRNLDESPVAEASVILYNPDGTIEWEGTTNSTGYAELIAVFNEYSGPNRRNLIVKKGDYYSSINIEFESRSVTGDIPAIIIKPCSGSLSSALSPNPSDIDEKITAITNEVNYCYGGKIYVKEGSCSGTEKCSCELTLPFDYYVSHSCPTKFYVSECECSFTAPNTEGTYIYYACIDMNDNGVFDEGESTSATLTVKFPKKKNGEPCSSNDECESGHCVHNICRPTDPYCGDGFCDIEENKCTCSNDCGSCSGSCGNCGTYVCVDSICQCTNDRKANEESCSSDPECCSNYCSNNKCSIRPSPSGGGGPVGSLCGNGRCESGEDSISCPQDCPGIDIEWLRKGIDDLIKDIGNFINSIVEALREWGILK